MTEPTPATEPPSHDPDEEIPALPKSAEDRKQAAALSSLDARHEEEEAANKKSHADHEALGKAMSRLDVSGTKGAPSAKPAVAEEKKKVKVDPADLSLLMEQLELSKIKATELLRNYDGDAIKTLKAFITATV